MSKIDKQAGAILEAGDAARVQKDQLSHAEEQAFQMKRSLDGTIAQGERQDQALDEMLAWMSAVEEGQPEAAAMPIASYESSAVRSGIQMTRTIPVLSEDSWEKYLESAKWYAELEHIDLTTDPYLSLLSQREQDDFAKLVQEDYYDRKAECDAIDYALSALSGTIAGAIDVFFVKTPTNSLLGKWTDAQADEFVKKVSQKLWESDKPLRDQIKQRAKESGLGAEWRDRELKNAGIPYSQNINKRPETLQQCIQYLEKKFGVSYDAPNWKALDIDGFLTDSLKNVGVGDCKSKEELLEKISSLDLSTMTGRDIDCLNKLKAISGMTASNHHLWSLAHIPSLIGLLFAIIDQFTEKATFITGGELIRLAPVKKANAIDDFELRGSDVPSKIVCAVLNWIGHSLSDFVGSNTTRASGSKSRGMGLPLPGVELFQFLSLTNFKITKDLADLANSLFEKGYDLRFGIATAIPVAVNELLTRLAFAIKRYYYHHLPLKQCIPADSKSTKQPELRRMLLVAHGTMCLWDAGDAAISFAKGEGWIGAALHLNYIAYVRLAHVGLSEVRARYHQEHIDIKKITEDTQQEWERLSVEAQAWAPVGLEASIE